MLIACCGDSDPPVFRHVARSIAARNPDLILFAGDARAEGFGITRRHAAKWHRVWGDLVDRLISVPGNHDYDRDSGHAWTSSAAWETSRGYRRFEGGHAFVLQFPEVTVIGLDAGPHAQSVSPAQRAWVASALIAEPTRPHRIAVVHSPAFPVSQHIGSALDAFPESRDDLWSFLEDVGVGLVISGHEHLYARRTILRRVPIVQMITGGAGAALSPVLSADISEAHSSHHAVALDVSPHEIRGEAFTPSGLILDRFTIGSAGPLVGGR